MPSRHGSVHSLNSPPSLLYTMSDLDIPSAQHPSLTNLHNPNNLNMERNNMYDMYDAPPTTGEGSGGMAVRPKRKQVKNACSACQRACKRCDVGRPCERCIKYGMADTCRDSQRKERKKGIKRGPYKKRDGESAVPHGPDTSAHAPPGMINDLQRMSPKRIARVPSAQVDLSAANLIPIDVDPPVREYSYQTPMITHTPPLSLAAMQPQYQHPNSNPHQASSSYSEDQYYTRYDHLPAPARSHYRTDEDYSRHVQPQPQPVQPVQPVQDYTRSPMNLQYPSPEHSPPRERQYPVYDNSSRQMVQPVHHDPSYQAQSDSMAHDESHDTRVMDPYYATHHQQQPQRQYSSESHMSDVHQQQDQQYYNYNAYQQPSTSYSHSHSHPQQQQHQQPQQYGYPQNHVPQQQAMAQTQNDAGYSQHLNYSTGASMNTYPTQPHHQMDTGVQQLQYTARSPMKMVHRGSFDATAGMVAHSHHSHHPQHHHQHHPQHVGNVQIQSN